jgi:hypothetical protein
MLASDFHSVMRNFVAFLGILCQRCVVGSHLSLFREQVWKPCRRYTAVQQAHVRV